jgi:hypothetical protein
VLARADLYPDGLAGAPLAVVAGGPVLLSPSDALDPRVEAEIRRVVPSTAPVHLLGGTAALSAGVEARLRALGCAVVRHAGAARYETAVQVAAALGQPGRVVLVRGDSFADALPARSMCVQDAVAAGLSDHDVRAGAQDHDLSLRREIQIAAGIDVLHAAARELIGAAGHLDADRGPRGIRLMDGRSQRATFAVHRARHLNGDTGVATKTHQRKRCGRQCCEKRTQPHKALLNWA